MANDIQDPKNPMAERDEPVPSRVDNLAHFKKRSEEQQPASGVQTGDGSSSRGQANVGQVPAVEPSGPVGVYTLQPDPVRRIARVTRVNPTTGELIITSYEAHIVYAEQGALVLQTVQGGTAWTRKILAPGTWIDAELSQPTRAEQEDYIARIDKFAVEQNMMIRSVQLAEQEAARQRAVTAGARDENGPRLGEAVDGRRTAWDKKFDLN